MRATKGGLGGEQKAKYTRTLGVLLLGVALALFLAGVGFLAGLYGRRVGHTAHGQHSSGVAVKGSMREKHAFTEPIVPVGGRRAVYCMPSIARMHIAQQQWVACHSIAFGQHAAS